MQTPYYFECNACSLRKFVCVDFVQSDLSLHQCNPFGRLWPPALRSLSHSRVQWAIFKLRGLFFIWRQPMSMPVEASLFRGPPWDALPKYQHAKLQLSSASPCCWISSLARAVGFPQVGSWTLECVCVGGGARLCAWCSLNSLPSSVPAAWECHAHSAHAVQSLSVCR